MRTLRAPLARSVALVSLVPFLLACSPPSSTTPATGEPGSPVGKPAPGFELSNLEGSKVSLASLQGKTVLLDFWATWCKPCHEQTRILTPLYEELRSQGAEFLAVNSGEDEETVRRFVTKNPFAYPVLLDPEDSLAAKLDVIALPTLVVLDRKGKVVFFQEGIAEAKAIRDELARAGR
jgi:peroxiredoxin